MKKKIRESKNNLKRNMSYELTIFNDNGIQETRTSEDLQRLKDIADDQYEDTNYDYLIIDNQTGEQVYSNYEYVEDEKHKEEDEDDIEDNSNNRLMKIPDNVLHYIYNTIGGTYHAGGDPYDTVEEVLRQYGLNPYYYTEKAYDQFEKLFGITINDAAAEIAAGGIEPRVESIFVKSTLNLLNEREKRQLYRMLKEERYADELPDDDFYGYGYDEGYAEDDQYIMRKTKQRLISGSLYTIEDTGEMYCGVCKTVQSTHNKICDVCGSDDVFNYW